jgi:formamidopyrimidine-DNA glycosylase
MPELPEVETVKLGLQKYLKGHSFEDVEILTKGILEGDPKDIIGAKVIEIRRFGKGLVIDLDNKKSIAIHIKLTGQMIYRDHKTINVPVSPHKVKTLPNNATRIIFKLDKDAILYFNDLRKFAWIRVVETSKVEEMPFFKNMGPEPFGAAQGKPDRDLTLEKFEAIVSNSKIQIKPLIMDQTRIGGIGNIYANDALFLAGIDPRRRANSLSLPEIKKLYKSVLNVMEKSMKYGGASELNFVNVMGQEGGYQNHSLVYGKRGKECPNKNGIIQKIFLGGRGTFFCEECQK